MLGFAYRVFFREATLLACLVLSDASQKVRVLGGSSLDCAEVKLVLSIQVCELSVPVCVAGVYFWIY